MRRMYSEKQVQEIVKNTKGYDIANLVDEEGHERFLEGDITCEEITGVVQKFGKWSLSGTHLQIVIAADVASGTTLGVKLADIELPSWIREKIIPLYSSRVAYVNGLALKNDNSTQQITYLVDKATKGLSVYPYITVSADIHIRFELDLLID